MHITDEVSVDVARALDAYVHAGYGVAIGGVLPFENGVIHYDVGVKSGCFTG